MKGTLAAVVAYGLTWGFQLWLGGALGGFETPHTPGMLKLAARMAVVCGGGLLGTVVFVLTAGALGVDEMGPLSKLARKILPKKQR